VSITCVSTHSTVQTSRPYFQKKNPTAMLILVAVQVGVLSMLLGKQCCGMGFLGSVDDWVTINR
jgi:hypothetical protein